MNDSLYECDAYVIVKIIKVWGVVLSESLVSGFFDQEEALREARLKNETPGWDIFVKFSYECRKVTLTNPHKRTSSILFLVVHKPYFGLVQEFLAPQIVKILGAYPNIEDAEQAILYAHPYDGLAAVEPLHFKELF